MDSLHFVNGSSRSTQPTSSFQSESLVVLSKPCLLSTSICQETSWMQSIILQQEASTFAKRKVKQCTTAECTTLNIPSAPLEKKKYDRHKKEE